MNKKHIIPILAILAIYTTQAADPRAHLDPNKMAIHNLLNQLQPPQILHLTEYSPADIERMESDSDSDTYEEYPIKIIGTQLVKRSAHSAFKPYATKRARIEKQKRYKCAHPGCNKDYKSSSSLTIHKRVHTGEKPYKCDHPGCTHATTSNSSLTKHKRIHTGKKPYKCDHPGCTYDTTFKSNLTRHKRTHTGKKPYKCDYPGCTHANACKSNLTKHKKKNHKND